MILAEKITTLRKMNGMSQEDLAAELGVSRQSISKWEGAQSVPDLKRILAMAEIFGVSTDTLLKDEIDLDTNALQAASANEENETGRRRASEELPPLRQVSMEEAVAYLKAKAVSAGRTALGVMLCILSPILLIVLSGAQESEVLAISENQAAGIGMLVLICLVGCAVGLFIYDSMSMKRYEYMTKDLIETEYGVSGMVRERLERYSGDYTRYMVTGIILCVMSCVPVIAVGLLSESEFVGSIAVGLLLAMVAAGVMLIVRASTIMGSLKILLEEGEFSRDRKIENKRNERITGIYWGLAVIIYLASSFLTGRWDLTWIIWPIAGVGSGLMAAILKSVRSRDL